MVTYAVSENLLLPPSFTSDSVTGIIEQAQSHTTEKLTHSKVEDIIVLRYPHKGKNKRFAVLTRVASSKDLRSDRQKLLDYLNTLRAKKGKVGLTNWFESEAALAMAIQHEEGKPTSQAKEIEYILSGKLPKIKIAKPAVAKGAYRSPKEAKEHTHHTTHTPKKFKTKSKSSIKINGHAVGEVSAATVLTELGIDPRKGRILLRKHNISRSDPAAIRKFFKERA